MRLVRLVKALLQWITSNCIILVNAGSLVGTTAVTSVLGFAYWWVAARQFPPEAVGIASASVSSMTLLGSICMLGLGTLLITELPRQPGQEVSLISTALVVVGGVGGGIGLVFAVVSPYISAQFNPLKTSVAVIGVFAAGVSLTAISSVLDQALIGILRGNLQFWRNTFFAVAKLILLLVFGLSLPQKTGMTIYTAWAIGMALSLATLLGITLFKKGWLGRAVLPEWSLLRKLGPAAIQHHLLNLVLQAPGLILPVLVTVLLSAKVNAWFYVSWMIANFVFVVPGSLTTVLHAMSSAQQSSLHSRARVTLGFAFFASFIVVCVVQLATKQLLGLLGSSYAQQASWCLRILVLATFPYIIKSHYISFCRIHDRVARAMLSMLACAVLELGGAVLGTYLGGLLGLSLGLVLAGTLEAFCMFPTIYKTIRPVKGTLEVVAQENTRELEAIWLVDTLTLTTISPSYMLGGRTAARSGGRELARTESIQQNGSNGYHVKLPLRPVRLEHYLANDESTQTSNTEQTPACPIETSSKEIQVR
jgi:O-antigen/teichoic acid export membrane protein